MQTTLSLSCPLLFDRIFLFPENKGSTMFDTTILNDTAMKARLGYFLPALKS